MTNYPPGPPGGACSVLRRYYHGTGEDDPLVWFEGSGTSYAEARFLKTDRQGSVVAVTNVAGEALGMNSYDEYGIPGPGNRGRFQYTGQAWIPELGMYYYKARIYSPTLGRFLQTDPIGYDDQINLYAYVANDPVNHTDPTGNETGTFSNGCMGDSCMNIDPGGKVHEGALQVLGTIASVGSIFVPVEGIAIKGLGALGRALGIGEKAVDAVKVGSAVERGALSEAQATSLARFESKVPANSGPTTVTAGENGSVTVSATSPGKVPGSSATYTKTIGADGKTIPGSYTKTTVAQNGENCSCQAEKLNARWKGSIYYLTLSMAR